MKFSHRHATEETEIRVNEVVRAIKRKAEEEPNSAPAAIFRAVTQDVRDEEVLSNMPQRGNVLKNINRLQVSTRPQNPNDLASLELHGRYTRTLTNDEFLKFDNRDPENRILIFYTDEMLQRFVVSETILCDGTFKSVPGCFKQLYTLHGIIGGHLFPLVYALTCKKDTETYKTIFRHLKLAASRLNSTFAPRTIMSDFELAFMRAAKDEFPNARIKGCYFHWATAVWDHVSNLGLKVLFNENEIVRDFIRQLLALPFLPREDIEDIFDSFVNPLPEIEAIDTLLDYIERTYIRGRRGPARFPPDIWVVNDLVHEGIQRTNNVVEGWHSRFQYSLNVHHASFWKFVEFLQKDQRDNEIIILQILSGHSRIKHPIKKKNTQMPNSK